MKMLYVLGFLVGNERSFGMSVVDWKIVKLCEWYGKLLKSVIVEYDCYVVDGRVFIKSMV